MKTNKVLFLCTGNSCRSIMAEVMLNNMSTKFHAFSAGSFPTGQVNEDAIKLLDKNQLEYSELNSQSWDEFDGVDFDIVITVCDNAANESCPVYLGQSLKAHWGIPDPDKAIGANRELAFELAYKQLYARIEKLLMLSKIDSDSLNQIGKLPL